MVPPKITLDQAEEASTEPAPLAEVEQQPGPSGTPVRLDLRTTDLSPIYVGYVHNAELKSELAAQLGALWPGMSVAVEVGWGGAEEGGRFTLHVPRGESRAAALAGNIAAGEALEVGGLEPLLAPLGHFRSALAGRFDLRFLGFELQLAFQDSSSGLICRVLGESHDPEGRSVGPCFECDLETGEERLCRIGDSWPAPVEGSAAVRSALAAALQAAPSP